ncbi:hypothetical protein K474DRAFT_1603411 [Panus rudis PR-1116 ss-1]|nr:hypothetical protein K474DRAFT_1603411 [Panus rudis PR-1116 ss-1]
MAYNREWDRGKDNWNDNSYYDNSLWNDYGPRGNVRSRDDEYYNDGKRRKYNNGGYDSSQAYENSYDNGHGPSRQHHHDQDRDDRRGGGFGGKKRMIPSEPSSHVIFLGLDPDFTEADLQAYLTSNSCSVEMVTIIRDRTSGTYTPLRVSKGFGFAKFTSIEHARAFVDPLFPFIQVPPPASHGASAAAAFYKALETGEPHNGRRVKIDYSSSGNPMEKRRGANSNDGTRDIGNAQGPVLLFRGLDPLSGPGAIAHALKSSAGPGKDGAKGMKRIILIKDRMTQASWGFAFVEFIDVASAAAVLGATMSPQIHPSGFRISDRPVAASFAHPDSFQPLPDYSIRDEACLASSMSLGGMEGALVRYWDEASTVSVMEFKVEQPAQPALSSSGNVNKEKKEKRKAKDTHHDDKPVEASALPVSDKPVTLNFKGGFSAKLGGAASKKPATLSLAFSATEEDMTGGDARFVSLEMQESGVLDVFVDMSSTAALTVKKVAPMVTSKKVVNNISKWNQVQGELRDGTDNVAPIAPVQPDPVVVKTAPAAAAAIESKEKSTTPVPIESEFEFSDTNAKTCLLCARQFKSLDQLKRHNKESDLHKKNYKDANLRDVAREKAKAARLKALQAQQPLEQPQPKYRDRASERRIMHNQPDIPLPEGSTSSGVAIGSTMKKRSEQGPPPPPSPPPPPVNPGKDESNVGNKLLKMMGWKEGTGLGTDGSGRVDPIQTAVYAAGAGLGASKGKDIGRLTEGYGGYVHMAQDAARERYGS